MYGLQNFVAFLEFRDEFRYEGTLFHHVGFLEFGISVFTTLF